MKILKGKEAVIVFKEPNWKEADTIKGIIVDEDEYSVTIKDDYGNRIETLNRAIILRIKVKDGGDSNE